MVDESGVQSFGLGVVVDVPIVVELCNGCSDFIVGDLFFIQFLSKLFQGDGSSLHFKVVLQFGYSSEHFWFLLFLDWLVVVHCFFDDVLGISFIFVDIDFWHLRD